MNKRGEIIVLVIASLIIVFTLIGVFMVYDASNHLYVGDKETNVYLNYFECKGIAKGISDENLIIFKSREDAIRLGYNESIECV